MQVGRTLRGVNQYFVLACTAVTWLSAPLAVISFNCVTFNAIWVQQKNMRHIINIIERATLNGQFNIQNKKTKQSKELLS
jgi:hypothetical protein